MYSFENKHLHSLYEKARRFDEGEIYQSREYSDLIAHRTDIFDQIIAMCGEKVKDLLEEYTGLLYSEMEMEGKHFFLEGLRLALMNKGVMLF